MTAVFLPGGMVRPKQASEDDSPSSGSRTMVSTVRAGPLSIHRAPMYFSVSVGGMLVQYRSRWFSTRIANGPGAGRARDVGRGRRMSSPSSTSTSTSPAALTLVPDRVESKNHQTDIDLSQRQEMVCSRAAGRVRRGVSWGSGRREDGRGGRWGSCDEHAASHWHSDDDAFETRRIRPAALSADIAG